VRVSVQGISGWRREFGFVVLLALFAFFRALAFGAAFPLFHHVDEPEHIDLVHKFARGHFPDRESERIDPALAMQMALLISPEYLTDDEVFAGGKAPVPIWQRAASEQARDRKRVAARIERRVNHELNSPPLFYGVAALWLRAERRVGVPEPRALYGLRVLSALGLLFLVAGSYFLCARVFPERRTLRLGVPLLLACFPQDFFFSVSPDAWAPALGMGGLALLYRWRFATPAERSWGLSVSLGLAMAALFLTKLSNLPVVLVVLFAVGRRAFRERDERSALLHAVAVALVAALPVALWLGRNLAVFGTLTGTAGKVEALTWTPRALLPLTDFFAHPLFSAAGLWTFVSELSATFWRGELFWHGARLALPWVDGIFLAAGIFLLTSAALRATAWEEPARSMFHWSWATLALSLGLLVALSLAFDFGASRFPSADHPYFTSGRLIAVALFPFALLLVEGIDRWFAPGGNEWATLVVVGSLGALALGSELWLTAPVFASPYNYFALPASLP
jgi:hypothetical protein